MDSSSRYILNNHSISSGDGKLSSHDISIHWCAEQDGDQEGILLCVLDSVCIQIAMTIVREITTTENTVVTVSDSTYLTGVGGQSSVQAGGRRRHGQEFCYGAGGQKGGRVCSQVT